MLIIITDEDKNPVLLFHRLTSDTYNYQKQVIKDHWHFTHNKVFKRSLSPNHEKRIRLAVDTRVRWAQQQVAKRRVKRDISLQDSDPKWPSMWYLDPMASYDVNSHDSDPSPRYDMIDSNRHGTRCAGEVAATSNNSVCALGIAHGAQVGGVRMLDGDVTDAVEARSLSLNPHHIDIYSASWGPDDDGKTVDGPGELARRAFIEGVTKGRNGKGSIFVWASGNGGRDQDNCNCDGYTNSIYSLSISSATEHGHVPWYSEACSSTLASTYSSGAVGEKQVVTTDLRFACTSSHTGTSASAPLAAGICALALEANPNLTWRDMQHIVVRTARPENLIAPDWQTNGVGRNVSHSFGYGLMDAHAMVRLARHWKTVPEQNKCEIAAPHDQKAIPAKSVVILKLQVTKCDGVAFLEHVQARLTIFSQRRGDLNIQLTSPMGTRAVLLAHRTHDNSRTGFNHWPFMSVHSWGESPLGVWELEIHNDGRLLGRATLQNWSLVLYGTKEFVPNNESTPKPTKSKSATKKKNNKKLKNKINGKSVSTTKPSKISYRNKSKSTTTKMFSTLPTIKFKKVSKPTTELSPYFYSINNSKFRNSDADVKQYFKFVKNITITYPILIPSPDVVKPPELIKKPQKQKEKSRDINSNRNLKVPPSKPQVTTSSHSSTTTTPKITTANISGWTLVLHGTATSPNEDTTNHPSNNIDNISLNSWRGDEIRKDTLEVEEEEKSSSGCVKTKGQLCLECQPNYILRHGVCEPDCPRSYYKKRVKGYVHQEVEEAYSNFTCISCHYTCNTCRGGLDYDCLSCFPDAILTTQSQNENYCYPNSIHWLLQAQYMYYIFFLILFILLTLLFVALIWILWKLRKRNKWYYHNLKNNEIGILDKEQL
ncbi:hypothetical protein WA026_010488 [Henosepilachna vigintioctopunctata]|uniref:furin n=1 Tax=Henosepilachna vigintioctopunctata TaxID=420089 RepID=A0AAW1V6X6_9CUCU